jgi:hypothetical protein
MQGHCTHFLLLDWPWLHYHWNENDCCSSDHCWMLNTDQHWTPTGYASFEKINISLLGPQCTYRYFLEDTIYSDLFWVMMSINCWTATKIVGVVLEKIAILCWGLIWWASNYNIRQQPTTDKLFNTKYEQNPSNHSDAIGGHIYTSRQTLLFSGT